MRGNITRLQSATCETILAYMLTNFHGKSIEFFLEKQMKRVNLGIKGTMTLLTGTHPATRCEFLEYVGPCSRIHYF